MLRIIVIGSCLMALSQAAIAEPKYGARTKTLPSIEIRSDEPEVDAFLNMTCVSPVTLDVRIGGEIPKGKGELDPDSLTLSDGTLTTKIIGASVKSPDFEMTGGAMVLTSLQPKGRAISILTSGKTIEIKPASGASSKVTLGKPATDALKAFIAKCSQ
jgi:hypothetical protein